MLERAPEQRSAFLDSVCAGDQSPRQDVESVLASSDEARSGFLHSVTTSYLFCITVIMRRFCSFAL